MINKKIEEFISFVSPSKRILLMSNRNFSEYMDIFEKFEMVVFEGINENSIENLSFNFTKNHIDIVIFAPENDFENILSMYEKFKIISPNSDIILILPNNYQKNDLFQLINIYDSIMAENISRSILLNKIFTVLSTQYTLNNINFTSESMYKDIEDKNKKELEEFLDIYEGAVIFIIDDLNELIEELKNGTLSQELIENISKELMEVHEIFSIHNYTKKVAPIFKNFSKYLEELNLEDVKIENLEGFNYLKDILTDINVYLKEYFIDRTFQDVYVFKDSLESNIEFLKSKLSGKEDDESELEFF